MSAFAWSCGWVRHWAELAPCAGTPPGCLGVNAELQPASWHPSCPPLGNSSPPISAAAHGLCCLAAGGGELDCVVWGVGAAPGWPQFLAVPMHTMPAPSCPPAVPFQLAVLRCGLLRLHRWLLWCLLRASSCSASGGFSCPFLPGVPCTPDGQRVPLLPCWRSCAQGLLAARRGSVWLNSVVPSACSQCVNIRLRWGVGLHEGAKL